MSRFFRSKLLRPCVHFMCPRPWTMNMCLCMCIVSTLHFIAQPNTIHFDSSYSRLRGVNLFFCFFCFFFFFFARSYIGEIYDPFDWPLSDIIFASSYSYYVVVCVCFFSLVLPRLLPSDIELLRYPAILSAASIETLETHNRPPHVIIINRIVFSLAVMNLFFFSPLSLSRSHFLTPSQSLTLSLVDFFFRFCFLGIVVHSEFSIWCEKLCVGFAHAMAAKLQTQTSGRQQRREKTKKNGHRNCHTLSSRSNRKAKTYTRTKWTAAAAGMAAATKQKNQNLNFCASSCQLWLVRPWFHIYSRNKKRNEIRRIFYRYGFRLKSYFVLLLSLFLYRYFRLRHRLTTNTPTMRLPSPLRLSSCNVNVFSITWHFVVFHFLAYTSAYKLH